MTSAPTRKRPSPGLLAAARLAADLSDQLGESVPQRIRELADYQKRATTDAAPTTRQCS